MVLESPYLVSGRSRGGSMGSMGELKLIYALLPLLLGMVICYQCESAHFPAPYADNQLLCSLCGPKRSHAFNSAGSKHNNQV